VTIRATEHAAVPQADENALLECDPNLNAVLGPTIVQITSETMGVGDDELGGLLMRSFIKTQLQLETPPDALVFYNGGVRLCCRDSLLVDDLEAVAAKGVEIIACGTCLNFFELGDRLAVGRVTDMLEIASVLASAGRVVRP
jgi:selenium metabolism protein YedF